MSSTHALALKISAVLWVIWGLVHMLAGALVIPADATGGFQAIADAVDPALLVADYHPAVGGILDQHGWNLLWGGAVTLIGAIFIWRQSFTAIWVTAMVGGLLDVGYLVFVDIPGYVNFVPGTVMTMVSASAIILSFWVWLSNRQPV
ncbi:MAG: hypothetical protein ACFB0Z_04665 [Candidatus Phaeomarinobacter sp.]